MRKFTASGLTILFVVLCAKPAIAQSLPSDTLFRSMAIQNMFDAYHKATGISSNLYNGTRYESYYPGFEKTSHQFFKINDFSKGWVKYDGLVYNGVLLMYDIIRDDLVLKYPDNSSWITLVKEKIESFSLQGYNFVKIKKDNQLNLSEGFYNVLYAGSISLLAKHEKRRAEFIDQRAVFSKAMERTTYYVVKDGKAFAVKNKKSLLNVLADKKGQLNQYARQQQLNFRKDIETAMVQTVKYYDTLTR